MSSTEQLRRRLDALAPAHQAGRVKLPREMTDDELLQKIREDLLMHGHPEQAALSNENLIAAIRNRTIHSGYDGDEMGDDPA
jgi:hypothetical protein